MNREEAQLHLDATTLRPKDADAAALAWVEQDADLRAWLTKRTAFDESVADALEQSAAPARPPAHLLQALQAESAKRQQRGRAQFLITALAALLLMGGAALWIGNPAGSSMAVWEQEALAHLELIESGDLELEHSAPSVENLKPLLASAGAVMPGALPLVLNKTKTYGCTVVQLAGRPATVVCFKLGGGREAHLVVAKEVSHAARQQPLYASHDGWQTARWSDGTRTYLLATHEDMNVLKALLALAVRRQNSSAVAAHRSEDEERTPKQRHLLATLSIPGSASSRLASAIRNFMSLKG